MTLPSAPAPFSFLFSAPLSIASTKGLQTPFGSPITQASTCPSSSIFCTSSTLRLLYTTFALSYPSNSYPASWRENTCVKFRWGWEERRLVRVWPVDPRAPMRARRLGWVVVGGGTTVAYPRLDEGRSFLA